MSVPGVIRWLEKESNSLSASQYIDETIFRESKWAATLKRLHGVNVNIDVGSAHHAFPGGFRPRQIADHLLRTLSAALGPTTSGCRYTAGRRCANITGNLLS